MTNLWRASFPDGDSGYAGYALTLTLTVVVGFLLTLKALSFILLPPQASFLNLRRGKAGYHVVITGGSSGIGLSLALLCAKKDGVKHITLIARNLAKLNEAKAAVEAALQSSSSSSASSSSPSDTQCQVHVESLDLCCSTDVAFAALCTRVDSLCQSRGPPAILFNCAGTSVAQPFSSTPFSTFPSLIGANLYSAAAAIKAFMPHLVRFRGTSGHASRVVVTSSGAGQVGLYGYTAYASSKFALRGLTESLLNELDPSLVTLTVAYPPNTETPGFAAENVSKPRETRLMEDEAGLWKSDVVAEKMLDHACRGLCSCYWGLEGWMLATLTCGMGPVDNLWDLVAQILLMGLLRFISLFYLASFRGIVVKCRKEREAELGKSEVERAGAAASKAS